MILILQASTGENKKLAEQLHEILKEQGKSNEIVDLVSLNLPLYSTEAEKEQGVPSGAQDLTQKMIDASGFIVVAPEYNGSIPPVLVNAISWISRAGEDWRAAFNQKFSLVATHSGGGGLKVLNAMRQQLNHLGCNVLARELLTNYQKPLNLESAQNTLTQLCQIIGE